MSIAQINRRWKCESMKATADVIDFPVRGQTNVFVRIQFCFDLLAVIQSNMLSNNKSTFDRIFPIYFSRETNAIALACFWFMASSAQFS